MRRSLAALLLFAVGCGPGVDEDAAGSAELLGEPASNVDPPIPGEQPDLSACGTGPTISDTTVFDELSRVAGFEATNTDRDCSVEPAPCGAWWARLRPNGDGPRRLEIDDHLVQEIVFATDPVDDGGGCELHVAESVTGTFEKLEYFDTDTGRVHPIDLCAVDEHGHVATGRIDLFVPRNRVEGTRAPCP